MSKTPLIRRIVGLVSLCAALGTVAPAFAQGVYSEGQTLEFRTDLPWARLSIVGNEEVSGVSPLSVPGPASGRYWVRAAGEGVERQLGRVNIHLDEDGARIASYGGLPVWQTTRRATAYPGYAQWRYGDGGRGSLMALSATASLALTLVAQQQLWDATNALEAADRSVEQAASAADLLAAENTFRDAREEEEFHRQRRDLMLYGTAVAWGVSYVDALLFAPRLRVSQAGERSLVLGMRSKTRLDAGLRSLVFPGLGQAYNGHKTKAGWMALGGITAAGFFLYTQDRYDEANAELKKLDARLNHATTIEEQVALQASRDAQFAEVDDRFSDRNVALIASGVYWGLSVLDAIVTQDEAWGTTNVRRSGPSFGWNVDPVRSRICARCRF